MADVIALLLQLGFSEYEARAYLALLQRNPLNGYELAKVSGLPRANVYAVLQKLEDLEIETVAWCRRMLQHSPLALRMLKASLNAADDGLAGIQQLAGDATLLYYMSEEAQEGKTAYLERRRPEFDRFPKRP